MAKKKRLWLSKDTDYKIWYSSEPPQKSRTSRYFISDDLNVDWPHGVCSEQFEEMLPQFTLDEGECIPLRSTPRGLVRGDRKA